LGIDFYKHFAHCWLGDGPSCRQIPIFFRWKSCGRF